MKKIVMVLVVLVCMACALLTSIFAQPKVEDTEAIIAKLDQIIATQAEMMDYLKFIKNRSR
jgi:hypothetical protein